MADDSPARRFKVNLLIKGMENVVATVTGYTGSERFNLIKLISIAGANYVGKMSESVSHLVCWKYEGRKFELAREFKVLIVNHQWVEDCLKEGRRLPEDPYALQCGQDVGPLMLNIQFLTDKMRDPGAQNKNLLPEELEQNRRTSKRKINKGHGVQENSSTRTYCSLETNSLGFQWVEFEGLHSPQCPIFMSQKKGKSASPEPSRRGCKRRLVKKNVIKETLDLISDSDQENPSQENLHEQNTSVAVSNHSAQKDECQLSPVHVCDSTCHECGQNRTEDLNDVECIDHVNDALDFGDQSVYINGASSYRVGDVDANDRDVQHATRLPTSMELSCVICWTDFSSTRGVLPCGHRFCFLCIQSWADHMASSGKASTCPLCKATFISITKVDDAVSSDQKIYSQSIPRDDSRMNIYILPAGETPNIPSNSSGAPVCCQCSRREPEDLLERCQVCQIQHIHIYCLDPPLFPWTCVSCKDLQRLYLHRR